MNTKVYKTCILTVSCVSLIKLRAAYCYPHWLVNSKGWFCSPGLVRVICKQTNFLESNSFIKCVKAWWQFYSMSDYVLNFSSGLFQLFPPSWEPLGQLCCIFILCANENVLEAGPNHDPPLVGQLEVEEGSGKLRKTGSEKNAWRDLCDSAGRRVVCSALQAGLLRTHWFAVKKSFMMFRGR